MSPRLIPLAEAKAYLGGRHPVSLGIPPVARARFDAISPPPTSTQGQPMTVTVLERAP